MFAAADRSRIPPPPPRSPTTTTTTTTVDEPKTPAVATGSGIHNHRLHRHDQHQHHHHAPRSPPAAHRPSTASSASSSLYLSAPGSPPPPASAPSVVAPPDTTAPPALRVSSGREPLCDPPAAKAGKVDSILGTTASSNKSRPHSRFASFSRIRLRDSLQHQTPRPPPETLPVDRAALLENPPNDRSRSGTPTLSNSSSETVLSEEKKSLEEQPSRPSFWLASNNASRQAVKEEQGETEGDQDEQQQRSRMMHQTSSRLLRMTDDERPFTKDVKDLFSTLMVSLPLTPHRVRFTRIEHTFTTEEATTNLGSLKFSQSNRMPDPKDPGRIVTTTTTTTFSMAKEMARATCQRFLDSRFIESLDGKNDFSSRNSVWQLTPKGLQVLWRFCQRNGIHQRHVNELLDSPRNMMNLVILERIPETDKLVSDGPTINVIFKRFAGDTGPNLKSASTASDSDSMIDYATGLIGVKMQRSRRQDKNVPYLFSGKSGYDWLMDCCTIVDKNEVYALAQHFLNQGLTEPVIDDRHPQTQLKKEGHEFLASKHMMYAITQKGMRVAGWNQSGSNGTVNVETAVRVPNGVSRDSNTNRMTVIIADPALRLLFREYLRETHCEENLSFYVEVRAFLEEYERAKRTASPPRQDIIRETLASAYSLYNAFLAPGSPCELNIDHNLRNALAGRMTRAVGEEGDMLASLDEVASLFDQAQGSVFKLMASDSVPKFFREPKYARSLRERNLEGLINGFATTSLG